MDTRQIARKITKVANIASWTGAATLGVLCGTAGTLSGTDADGNSFSDLPLQQGYNPISVIAMTGGDADDVWVLH